MNSEVVILFEQPRLRRPCMVVGFSGWLDGGEASTGVVRYLINKLHATRFGELATPLFQVNQVPGAESLRPKVKTTDGVITEITYPHDDLYAWVNERDDGPDVILLWGTEPNLRWREYIDGVLDVAERFNVRRLYSAGGVLDRIPFTAEPVISCAVSDAKLKDELESYAVRYSNYEGPSTFNSAIIGACHERGIEAVHMTARAMYYPDFNIVVPHNPKAIHAIVRRLNRLMGMGLDLSDLRQSSRELEDKLTALAGRNAEFRHYITQLEQSFTGEPYDEPIEGRAEDFVRDAEEFLRRQRENGPNGGST